MACACIFAGISSFIVLIQFFKIVLPWIYNKYIAPKFGPKIDVRKMGEWALVTGATEGIGKAYANELAKKGLNVVLVSRSAEKLSNVAKEIESEHKVKVKTIAVDFTNGIEIYKKIESEIEGLEIGVLVNNVGISYSLPDYFLNLPDLDKFLQDIVNCNIHSVTYMCKMLLPKMVERKKGVIINISSMSANIPSPLLAVYAGTKAFVDKFSGDLQIEYKNDGVIIQSVLPGFVATNMSKIKKTSYMAPSPNLYASSALRTLGIETHTYGYFPHALMKLAIDAIKFCLPLSIAHDIFLRQLKQMRDRAQKRQKSK